MSVNLNDNLKEWIENLEYALKFLENPSEREQEAIHGFIVDAPYAVSETIESMKMFLKTRIASKEPSDAAN